MPQPYEITILILGIGVLGYILLHARRDIRRIPYSGLLLSSFFIQFCSWILSALHRSLWTGLSDAIEALLTMGATVLLGIWCYLTGKPEAGREL